MGQRQLNIRSNEAVGLAAELAGRLGSTTTDVVVQALRALKERTEPRDDLGLTLAQRQRHDALRDAVRELRPYVPSGMTSDHSWLYDEDGLPK